MLSMWAGMLSLCAGMLSVCAGMLAVCAGILALSAGMSASCAGMSLPRTGIVHPVCVHVRHELLECSSCGLEWSPGALEYSPCVLECLFYAETWKNGAPESVYDLRLWRKEHFQCGRRPVDKALTEKKRKQFFDVHLACCLYTIFPTVECTFYVDRAGLLHF